MWASQEVYQKEERCESFTRVGNSTKKEFFKILGWREASACF